MDALQETRPRIYQTTIEVNGRPVEIIEDNDPIEFFGGKVPEINRIGSSCGPHGSQQLRLQVCNRAIAESFVQTVGGSIEELDGIVFFYPYYNSTPQQFAPFHEWVGSFFEIKTHQDFEAPHLRAKYGITAQHAISIHRVDHLTIGDLTIPGRQQHVSDNLCFFFGQSTGSPRVVLPTIESALWKKFPPHCRAQAPGILEIIKRNILPIQ